ncbi:kinase-like domain-containing protein [Rhizophagus irregularis DAOM 181602=DAOM 197198]|nr:kinase-like domain-containing protein [Rhizophagus irregularis DAOM 181602=DAOM 197198]
MCKIVIIENENPTKIIRSSGIGPVKTNNPGAIYRSRSLSGMIQSAMSTRSLDNYGSCEIFSDKIIKKIRSIENENNDYIKQEFGYKIY